MKNKIIGLLICTLVIAVAAVPYVASMPTTQEKIEDAEVHSQKPQIIGNMSIS